LPKGEDPRAIGLFKARSLRDACVLLKTPTPKVVLPRNKRLRAVERRT